MFKLIKKFIKENTGITLIELVIAITVMTMMLGITAIYLPTYRANQVKKQAALDLNDSLRFAQSLAASPESGDIEFYHWHYDTDANNMIVTDSNDANERVFKFDSADKIEIVTNIEDIYIKTKTPALYADEDLTTEAAGTIQVYHNAMKSENDLFYQINVSNNSFNITREKVGENDDFNALIDSNDNYDGRYEQ